MSLCASCMERPAVIKGARLCKACYCREWRKSQGPDSAYRRRASLSSVKRVSGGRLVCGEVHEAPPGSSPQAIETYPPQPSRVRVSA